MSTTTPTVIRDSIDPLVVTTKFDIDHEYDAETAVLTHADITSTLYVQHGDHAIKLDFGIFGDPTSDYLRDEYQAEVEALDILISRLEDVRGYLEEHYMAVVAATIA